MPLSGDADKLGETIAQAFNGSRPGRLRTLFTSLKKWLHQPAKSATLITHALPGFNRKEIICSSPNK